MQKTLFAVVLTICTLASLRSLLLMRELRAQVAHFEQRFTERSAEPTSLPPIRAVCSGAEIDEDALARRLAARIAGNTVDPHTETAEEATEQPTERGSEQADKLVANLRGRTIQLRDWNELGRDISSIDGEKAREEALRRVYDLINKGELKPPREGDLMQALLAPPAN